MISLSELQSFKFEGNKVRTIQISQNTWFAASDVVKNLGLTNTTVAISKLDEDEVTKFNLGSQSGITNFISEPGLYKLIGASRKPEAKRFNRWVTHEVLPTIRRHGAYMTDKKAYEITHDKDALADLLVQAGNQLKEKDLVIEEMKPKALFADSVATSHTSILVGDLAKILKQNGVDIGAKRLFIWLRQNKYLISRRGSDYNSPTQKSMEMGLFEIKESPHINGDGVTVTTQTPKVTGKGQQYFINKFLRERKK